MGPTRQDSGRRLPQESRRIFRTSLQRVQNADGGRPGGRAPLRHTRWLLRWRCESFSWLFAEDVYVSRISSNAATRAKVFIRSPRSISRTNGTHEVRCVPPRALACCGIDGRSFAPSL